MNCKKCKKEIPDGSVFCNHCGAKQFRERAVRRRGSGTGTAYRDSKTGKWIAEYTVGWDDDDGTLHRVRRKKRGFATKAEALAYIPELKQELPQQDLKVKFKDFYKQWLEIHTAKVTKSTMDCYRSAYKYYEQLYYNEISNIRTEHLQKCIDECPKGNRTKENMKALGTLLWRYAMQLDIVDRNYAEYIYIKKEEKAERVAFSQEQLASMWENVDQVPGIKYILLLCYTGMRVNEMLEALTSNYHPEEGYFTAGSKTEAGRNRIITISPKIQPFFEEYGTGEYLFTGDKLPLKRFRNEIFYPALKALGIETSNTDVHTYTPHCCRHTFATLMKDINAPVTDKQKLIGHANFEMTAHYTHTDLESLKRITNFL